MRLSKQILEEIKKDINACDAFSTTEGSEDFYSELVAKYSTIDDKFLVNLSTNGKSRLL